MRFVKPLQCAAIIQPGELVIDIFDGKQCTERSAMQLVKCEHCDNWYCLMSHWGKHLNSLPPEPNDCSKHRGMPV